MEPTFLQLSHREGTAHHKKRLKLGAPVAALKSAGLCAFACGASDRWLGESFTVVLNTDLRRFSVWESAQVVSSLLAECGLQEADQRRWSRLFDSSGRRARDVFR